MFFVNLDAIALPYGLVPLYFLAKQLKISVPNIKNLIQRCAAVSGVDYLAEGYNLEKLGIANMSIVEMNNYMNEGATER